MNLFNNKVKTECFSTSLDKSGLEQDLVSGGLEYWLDQDAVHSGLNSRLFELLLCIRRQAADDRLNSWNILAVLHKFADSLGCRWPVAARHAVIHEYQPVHRLVRLATIHDELDSFVTARARVTFKVELSKKALNCAAVEDVVVYDEKLFRSLD